MPNYQIIPITEYYIESFREAVGSVAREQKYLSFLDTPSIEMAQAFVMENLRDDWPHFVAIVDDKVVGWCDITSLHRPVLAHVGVLGIGVLSGFRGQGIGEALMRSAVEKAKIKGLTRIELTVRENNKPAIALYKKLGFEIEGLHRNAIRINGIYENQYFMALLFEDEYEDLPELTDEMMERAVYKVAGVEKVPPRHRGKQKSPTKIPLQIRLPPEVVEYFKEEGTGWQSRIGEVLKKWIKTHPHHHK